MANDFSIGLVAGLDNGKSKKQLNSDIEALKKQLSNIELEAKLDKNVIAKLQSDLNAVQIELKNVNIDQSAINRMVSQINSALSGININLGQNIGGNIQQQVQNSIGNSAQIIDRFRQSLANIGMTTGEIDTVINRINSLGVEIDSLNQSMSTISGKKRNRNILSVDVSGIDKFGQAVKQTQQYEIDFDNYTATLIKDIDSVSTAQQKAASSATTFAEKQKIVAQNLRDEINLLNSKAIDEGASRSITDQGHLTKLETKYNEITNAITKMESASRDAFIDEQNNVKSLITDYKALVSEYQNAENVRTSLKADKLAEGISKAQSQYKALQAQMENSGVTYSDKLNEAVSRIDNLFGNDKGASMTKAQVEEVFTLLSNAKNELDALIKVDTSNSSIQKLSIQANELKEKITAFEKNNPSFSTYEKEIDGTKISVEELKNALDDVNNTSNLKLLQATFNNLTTSFKTTSSEAQNLSDKIKSIKESVSDNGNITTSITALENNFTKLGLSTDEVRQKMVAVKSEFATLQSYVNGNGTDAQINMQFEKVNAVLKQTQNDLKSTRSEYGLLVSEQRRLSMANTIESWNQKNSAALKEVRNENEKYIASLRDLNTQMTKMDFSKIQIGFKNNENSMRAIDKLGASFTNKMKQATESFTQWVSVSSAVMLLVNDIRKIPQIVTELDTALVDLKKTSSMTSSELKNFYYTSSDTAKQMGVSTKEIIEQASAWSRLGYSTAEAATKMAKYSAMFKTISPGMDLDSATNGLVSIMKAFKIGEENVDDVVDGIMSKINIIGNTQALDNSDIVDFLTRSSSAMAEANNTLEETIALGTAATEITRDAASVGNMLKTVSMRIRGYSEETEAYTNDVEELSGAIADLTKTASTPGGISLFTDDTKETYKSTYELLKEISGIWSDLTDKDQAQLLEVLAGKRQGQAVSAIISNFGAVEKSMESMANSAGNAEAEMSVAMDSIEYKANILKETGTAIAQNLFTQNDAKTILSFFTSIAGGIEKATDNLGLFKTATLGISAALSFKNVGIGTLVAY